jgi:predicted ATPase
MSKERCLLEVVAVINGLCLLIRKKRTQQELRTLSKDITEAFASDFSMLAQLLPNIYALSPSRTAATGGGSGIRLNLQSVCFIVQRFMRVVSSKAHPVMVFLDDLQWCDSSALTLIEDILCDSIGSSCFFVGSYRSNEVEMDHGLFQLIDSLSSHGILMTTLSLEGLTPEALNNMCELEISRVPSIIFNISHTLISLPAIKIRSNSVAQGLRRNGNLPTYI